MSMFKLINPEKYQATSKSQASHGPGLQPVTFGSFQIANRWSSELFTSLHCFLFKEPLISELFKFAFFYF